MAEDLRIRSYFASSLSRIFFTMKMRIAIASARETSVNANATKP